MGKHNIQALEQLLGYNFIDEALIFEALSHPSLNHNQHAKNSPKISNYERLEFLGDSVLNLVISELIYHRYSEYDEGMLAKLRASLVCKEQISQIAKSLKLAEYIIMTEGEEKSGGRLNENNLENAMEAIIGAIYLDSNLEEVKKVISKLWKDVLASPVELYADPKSALQEWVQARKLPIPSYDVVEQTGSSHSPLFKVQIKVDGVSAVGVGKSKKAAEKEAAKLLLKKISNNS
ncbi:MAG: rnc [Rickettsiaceae bacterium]|jgi:ribonuclease III|nr:rnc [Rickettsiaceae bacterium]